MKNIIYRYSRSFFLTAELTRRVESRVAILYPSTRYSIMQRTTEYLIRVYIVAVIAIAGLFLCAEFSVYYGMLSAMVVYAVMNTSVYEALDRLEMKLLSQLEKFVSDVRFRFQFDGMLEEAIQDAINLAEYEMSIQGEKILECLKNYYKKEQEDYGEIAPNNYFLTFYSICIMTLKYGDKKVDGQSMFIKNLAYLKEDINIEQLKRRKIRNEFMGLFGLTLLPVFAIKPIERWALSNMPEMKEAYYGVEGMMITIFLVLFTIAVYKMINMLKRSNHNVKYKTPWVEKLAEWENIRKLVFFYIRHRRTKAEQINRLLREVVYAYNLVEFFLLRWLEAVGYWILGMIAFTSIGIRGWLMVLLSMVCLMIGYFSRYIAILVKKQILIMEREEEIVRFQTIILMLMHIDRMTVTELLQRIEKFAIIFQSEIYELANTLSYKGMDTFREAKGKLGFHPYEKLLDSFLACDIMPIYEAFEDVETDRKYYVEKHKQENEDMIHKKSLIARTIAFLPLCMVIILKLIVPFVVQGIGSLSMNMMI